MKEQHFIDVPYLPRGNVCLAAVGNIYIETISVLEKYNCKTFNIKPLQSLPNPCSAHSDMQILHLGGDKILIPAETADLESRAFHENFDCKKIKSPLGSSYPEDIRLNFLIYNNAVIGRLDYMPEELKSFAEKKNYRLINSRQGYARCSTAIVNENAAITDDENIASILKDLGTDVLALPKGNILLPGYNYGFIGGCVGKLAPDILAFTGNLDKYIYGSEVKAFLKKYNVTPLELSDGGLVDIGGIVPLKEYI